MLYYVSFPQRRKEMFGDLHESCINNQSIGNTKAFIAAQGRIAYPRNRISEHFLEIIIQCCLIKKFLLFNGLKSVATIFYRSYGNRFRALI